jgi:Protein of unknown function with PCYCGC motif
MSKPSRKTTHPPTPPTPPAAPSRGKITLVVSAVGIAVVAVLVLLLTQSDRAEPVAPGQASSAPAAAAAQPAAAASTGSAQPAVLKPHPQTDFPPLQLPAYPLGRSPEVITAAYRFAAEHPEILTYIPCFCGCERSGHRGNEDCFVKSRAANGDVREWDEHGMECNVCLDVAQQAMQMFASGASVREIRSAVESKWASKMSSHTPTEQPPE